MSNPSLHTPAGGDTAFTSGGGLRGPWVLLGGAVFAVSFLFRFMVEPRLSNDFFMHVAVGRQMLLGDWLVRDITDPGLPLMHAMSALAEWLGGPTLLSEVTVSLVFLSLGAVLVFVLAAKVSRSRMIGLLATVPVVLVAPRLYAYPKLFCYPLAVWAMWRYLDRPNPTRVLWLGAVTAVAFLFRHDHGVYIGIAVAAMLVVRHWPSGVAVWSRAVGMYSLGVVLFLSPYMVFVQAQGGLVSYVRTGVEFSRYEAGKGFLAWPEWAPPPETRPPSIHVRWSGDAARDAAARGADEQRFHLENPESLAGATWRYTLGDPSTANVRALLDHPTVEETDGIDRFTGEVHGVDEANGQSVLWRLIRLVPLAAGGVSLVAANATPIIYYLVYVLPLAAIGLVVCRSILRTAVQGGADDAAGILGLAFLALLANIGMLRDELDVRVADVVVLPAIVGAWWVRVALDRAGLRWARLPALLSGIRGGASMRSVVQTACGGAAVLGVLLALGTVCVAAAARGGMVENWLERTGLDGGVSVAGIMSSVTEPFGDLSTSPAIDGYMPVEELRPLVRYIHECTRPTDRIFTSGFFPDIIFFSGRGFAGGHVFMRDQHRSQRAQRLTLDRLQRQSVPIALLQGGVDAQPPLVAGHFRTWYRPVTSIDPATVRDLTVMVDRRRVPSGRYAPLDAPCFL